jgi:hypothetical protein
VSEAYLCAFSELHPANAGLKVLLGRVMYHPHPELKPWAVLSDHFMVNNRPPSFFSNGFTREKHRGSQLSIDHLSLLIFQLFPVRYARSSAVKVAFVASNDSIRSALFFGPMIGKTGNG